MRRCLFAGLALNLVIWCAPTGRAEVPAKSEDRIPNLIHALDDPDPQKRTDALQRLINLGEPARAAIRLALPTASAQARSSMDRILLRIHWITPDDGETVEQVFTGYADLDAQNRCERVQQLMSTQGTPVDALMRVLLNDPSAAVRWFAADALLQQIDTNTQLATRLASVVDGREKPAIMYLPPNQNTPLLAAAAWVFHNRQPRRTDDLMQRVLALETEHPTAFAGQADFVYQWVIDRADLHRNRTKMIQVLRDQAARTPWTPDLMPQAISDLFAAHAEFGPFPGFHDDLVNYQNYLVHPRVLYSMAKLEQRRGNAIFAGILNSTALLLSGTSADDHLLAGSFLENHGWDVAAEREYQWALKLSGGNYAYVYFRLAAVAIDQNDELAAARYEELALQHSTDVQRTDREGHVSSWNSNDGWAEVHWHYLRAATNVHDPALIKKHLDKLLSLNAEFNVFHDNPSIAADVVPVLQEQGQPALADKIFNQAYDKLLQNVNDAPEDGMAKNNLAWLCVCSGRHLPEAKKLADQANIEAPQDAACLDTQAEVYWRLGDVDSAIQIETHALELKPDDSYMLKQIQKFKKDNRQPH